MKNYFEDDILSKRQRVERALNHQSVDRVPIHEQLSYNPRVAEYFSGRRIEGFNFDVRDIGKAVEATLDCTFPLFNPVGTGTEVTEDGFVYKLDNWTKWHVSKPFDDEDGAAVWVRQKIREMEEKLKNFDPDAERLAYRKYMQDMQALVGDTVIMDWSIVTGFCDLYDKIGLEIFSYFIYEYEDLLAEYMELSGTLAYKKAEAAGDLELSPVVLIAEDFCTMQGTIFNPKMLRKYHYPWVKKLTEAWHSHGLKVIYHTDGYFKPAIPDLIQCGVDGFYCLERNCNMNIEELVKEYPQFVWMGGVDGVNVMELGTPEDVVKEVTQIIEKTDALRKGGIFIDTSSEINPPIPLDNYLAMIETCHSFKNKNFKV